MNLKSIFLTVTAAFSLLSLTVFATTLDDIRPHVPSSDKTWAEQWFYNVAVPDVGYFKISLQSYIAVSYTHLTLPTKCWV